VRAPARKGVHVCVCEFMRPGPLFLSCLTRAAPPSPSPQAALYLVLNMRRSSPLPKRKLLLQVLSFSKCTAPPLVINMNRSPLVQDTPLMSRAAPSP